MTITIPADIEKAAVELSVLHGSTADDLILEALQAYFLTVPEPLQVEFDAWELATDQDINSLDQELNLDAVEAR